jgi:hypothetical protein
MPKKIYERQGYQEMHLFQLRESMSQTRKMCTRYIKIQDVIPLCW